MRYADYINRAHKLRLELFKNPDYEKLLSISQQASNIMQEAAYDPDIKSYDTIKGLVDSIGCIIDVIIEDIRKYDTIPGRCIDCEYYEKDGHYGECDFTTSILTPDCYCDRFRRREV